MESDAPEMVLEVAVIDEAASEAVDEGIDGTETDSMFKVDATELEVAEVENSTDEVALSEGDEAAAEDATAVEEASSVVVADSMAELRLAPEDDGVNTDELVVATSGPKDEVVGTLVLELVLVE